MHSRSGCAHPSLPAHTLDQHGGKQPRCARHVALEQGVQGKLQGGGGGGAGARVGRGLGRAVGDNPACPCGGLRAACGPPTEACTPHLGQHGAGLVLQALHARLVHLLQGLHRGLHRGTGAQGGGRRALWGRAAAGGAARRRCRRRCRPQARPAGADPACTRAWIAWAGCCCRACSRPCVRAWAAALGCGRRRGDGAGRALWWAGAGVSAVVQTWCRECPPCPHLACAFC